MHNTSSWDVVAVSGGKDLLEGVRLWHLRSPGAVHRLTIGKQKKQDIFPRISSTTQYETLSFSPECEYWRVPTTSKLPTQANNQCHIFKGTFHLLSDFDVRDVQWFTLQRSFSNTDLLKTQISISFAGKGFDVRGLRGHLVSWKGGEQQLFINHQLWHVICRSTVHLDVAWQNPGVTNMTQSTVWVSGWGIEIPWVSTHCAHGLYAEQINFETQGCDPTWKLICKGWDGDRRLSILGSWYWMSSICAGTSSLQLDFDAFWETYKERQ